MLVKLDHFPRVFIRVVGLPDEGWGNADDERLPDQWGDEPNEMGGLVGPRSRGFDSATVWSAGGVSKNRGPPKWMVKIMENPIKVDDFGGTTVLGNTHI